MKLLKLLAVFMVLSLSVAPVFSERTEKACLCQAGKGCDGSQTMSCSGKCSCEDASHYSQAHTCACQISLFFSPEAFDSGCLGFGQRDSRFNSNARESPQACSSGYSCGGAFPATAQANSCAVGPPDLDVVEYLPPSAKLVFNTLVSSGPLTQKDLISKTDLPPRTVRYALCRLKEESVIREYFYLRDARQSLYKLNSEASSAALAKVE